MPKSAPVFEPIDHETAAAAVIRQMQDLVLLGVFRPGDRLPAERELAKKFGVSRPTLRDALMHLEERGLLVAKRGGGTFVVDMLGSMFREPIVDLFKSSPRASNDFLEFRRDVEALASGYAAERATKTDIARLSEIISELRAAYDADDLIREAELDIELHAAIGEATHNVVLIHTLRSTYRLLKQNIFYTRDILDGLENARDQQMEQHQAIHDAILAGDRVAAHKAATDHIDFVIASLRETELECQREREAAQRLAGIRDFRSQADPR